jgi:extradiol dioxygenase family protein
MDPILHLSLPVRDLAESRRFYVDVLGCEIGREPEDFIDVWFYGLQLTLHLAPEQVQSAEERGVRHFGVTLSHAELSALLTHLEGQPVEWLSPVSTDYPGTPREQTKAKLLDPSGNVIEVKAYVDPSAAFETPLSAAARNRRTASADS